MSNILACDIGTSLFSCPNLSQQRSYIIVDACFSLRFTCVLVNFFFGII